MAGVNIPLVSVQHQYLITEKIEGVTPNLPTLRDPDRLTYWKEEVGGLVMGGYEPNPKPWAEDGCPRTSSSSFSTTISSTSSRCWSWRRPRAGHADGRYQGVHQRPRELHARRQLHPRRGAGGARHLCRGRFQRLRHRLGRRRRHGARRVGRQGRAALRSLAGRHPPLRPQPSRHELGAHAHARGLRQALHDGVAVRGVSLAAARSAARRSTTGSRRRALASARSSAGSGRTGLPISRAGEKAADIYSYERQNWFEAVGREHAACRERVAVFDQTSFAKFLLVGRDAEAALSLDLRQRRRQAAGTARLHADAERARRHRVRSDRRAAVAETEFYIVTGTGFATHDFDWISRSIPDGLDARLIDVTSAYAVLSLMGPRSRDVLAAVTDARHLERRLPVRHA